MPSVNAEGLALAAELKQVLKQDFDHEISIFKEISFHVTAPAFPDL